jgi:AraC-like DNA-binding protein
MLVAQANRLDSLGDVGRLAASAPDVGTALRKLVAHFKFHNGAALLWLEPGSELTALHYCVYEAREDSSSQLYAGVAVTICNVLGELCGTAWSAQEVQLPFRRPRDLGPYRALLHAPLVFDANSVAVRFSRRWLDLPVATADAALHASLESSFRDADAFGDIDFPSIVRRMIRRQLLVDSCSADDVAGALAMHRRTLDRRLHSSGVSFQELLDAVKYDVARHLLQETGLSVEQISIHLRYGSVGNFSTAFRRWSGESPRQFRARRVQPPSAIVAATSTMPTARNTIPESQGRAIVSFANR